MPTADDGFTANPIRSMGGLCTIPDTVRECVEPDAVRIFIVFKTGRLPAAAP